MSNWGKMAKAAYRTHGAMSALALKGKAVQTEAEEEAASEGEDAPSTEEPSHVHLIPICHHETSHHIVHMSLWTEL